ncbi:MlaA family lipoprotein [Caldimonas sp. KR1-144]|uniref:MlaA family lipoprotein n=1 Tax=Caldimonas sp. KR1-144 TaxID=3400911 RepID=UPI003C04D5D0
MKALMCAAALGAATLALSGCAAVTPRLSGDPLEPVNRAVFKFNESVDQHVLVPVATAYRDITPSPVRTGIDNFFHNFKDAWSAVNLLLQGRPADAGSDLMRFGINTVFGLAGFIDWAEPLGLERHDEDLGQTLGKWGVGAGPYLVLPLLGPSTFRDVTDVPFAIQLSPDQYSSDGITIGTLSVVRVVNARANLLGATQVIDEIALDKYQFIRDAYLQRRRSLIYDGNPPDEEDPYEPPPSLRSHERAAEEAAAAAGAAASAPGAPASGPAR